MIEGIPLSVSDISSITLTKKFLFFAYSDKYIAAPIPKGIAIARDTAVRISVFIREGKSDTFSELYFVEKIPFEVNNAGTPFTRI